MVTVVDTTPPVITVPAPIDVPATSPAGAPVSFTVTAVDNVDSNPQLTCTPPSGVMFHAGTTTVTCTASDFSGNASTSTFTVTVEGAATLLHKLQLLVDGMNLPTWLRIKLETDLGIASISLQAGYPASACSMLNVFISDVQTALAAHKISAADAAALIAAARQIKTSLGCP